MVVLNSSFPQVSSLKTSRQHALQSLETSKTLQKERQNHLSVNVGWCTQDNILGSCYLEQGSTILVAYAYVPRPGQGKGLNLTKGAVEVDVSYASHCSIPFTLAAASTSTSSSSTSFHYSLIDNPLRNPSLEESSSLSKDGILKSNRLSVAVQDAITPSLRLTAYPKCIISVSLMILQSSEQDASACINAASLALCQGGFEMKDLVTSNCLIHESSSSTTSAFITLACLPQTRTITYIDTIGSRSPDLMMSLIEKNLDSCESMRSLFSDALKKYAIDFSS